MPIVLKSGSLKLLETSGPAKASNEFALSLPFLASTFRVTGQRILSNDGKSRKKEVKGYFCEKIRRTMVCKKTQNHVLQFIGHFPKVDS
jgi:hypothetical protein